MVAGCPGLGAQAKRRLGAWVPGFGPRGGGVTSVEGLLNPLDALAVAVVRALGDREVSFTSLGALAIPVVGGFSATIESGVVRSSTA